MPHFPHTPETLLGRNDSKNPSTTCRGITSSGRPCRRALASPKSSPNSRRASNVSALNGVVALVQENGSIQEADFYCWQHQDQAQQRVEGGQKQNAKGRKAKRRSTELFPLQERSSIDTLVQRLGLDAASENGTQENTKPSRNPNPPRKTETTDFGVQQAPYADKYNLGRVQSYKAKKKPGFWASLCCMTGDNDDYVEIVRHKKRVEMQRPPDKSYTQPATASVPPRRKPLNEPQTSPGAQESTSQTNEYFKLIPQTLSPQTASLLMAEVIKPISPYDEEGYIYIFWLTPSSKTAPAESTAKALLDVPGRQPELNGRRVSDVMTEYSYDGTDDLESSTKSTRTKPRTIMLKIGRASNVTRRMNEWQRQCGYALNLVRWYPYIPSSGTPSPQPSPEYRRHEPLYPDLSKLPSQQSRPQSESGVHKVPCVKRVERLIHLELAQKQVKRQCTACGKEHREWFEVDASQAAVKAVDETVRRWVGWAERRGS